MSEQSFKLVRRPDGQWIASKHYRTRGLVEIECGDGSKKAAEAFAARTFAQRDQAAEAGRIRWRKTRAAAAAAPPTPPPTESPPPPADVEVEVDAVEDKTPTERPTSAPPPPDPPAPAAAADPGRAEQIRAKLLALGDGRPIEPDAVHPPGEDPRVDDEPMTEEQAAADNEAGELIADMIAGAVCVGHVKLIATRLKKKNPPKRPGEANERMMQWEREGIKYNAAKLFGASTRLGPTGKMIAGFVLVTLGMYIDAEPIEVAPTTSAAPSAPPQEETPAATPSPAPPPAPRARVLELHPLGRFK